MSRAAPLASSSRPCASTGPMALAEYQGDLKFNPKRFNGLYGAAQAAEMAGKASEASEYYALLVKTCEGGASGRAELVKARQAVVAAK